MLHVDLIELAWIIINLATFILTLVALLDARANQKAVRLLNGYARELVADGVVRRELIRLYLQAVFLAISVPSLFTVAPQRTALSILIICLLMSAAVALLWNSIRDRHDRDRMTVLVAADVMNQQETALNRIENKLDDNTRISQEASEHADKAYHEANSVNEKIATQGAAIIKQGENMDAAQERADDAIDTIEDTHDKVVDIHVEVTKP